MLLQCSTDDLKDFIMLGYFISFDTVALRVYAVNLYSEAAEMSFLKKQELTT